MEIGGKIKRQIKETWGLMLILYLPILIGMCMLQWISLSYEIPMKVFTRDPTTVLHGHPLAGFLTNIRLNLWSGTIAICVLNYFFHRHNSANKEAALFFLYSAAITLLLLTDDLFQFHEYLIPSLFQLPDYFTYSVLVTLTLAYLIRFKSFIYQTEFIFLMFACGILGSALILDLMTDVVQLGKWHRFIEDGLEFLGITSWFVYYMRVCIQYFPCKMCRKN